MLAIIQRHRSFGALRLRAVGVLLLFLAVQHTVAAGAGQVDWISIDTDQIAFGAEDQVFITTMNIFPEVQSSLTLEVRVRQAVLADRQLYIADSHGGLSSYDLRAPDHGVAPVPSWAGHQGALHLARMDDYLLVAEDGAGLSILALPPPKAHRHHSEGMMHSRHDLQLVGTLPLPSAFTAITTSVRTVFLATSDGRLLVVDAGRLDRPRLTREAELLTAATGLAANGESLLLLSNTGISRIDWSGKPVQQLQEDQARISGNAIQSAGRQIYLGTDSDTPVLLRDESAAAAIHFVSVGNFAFTPANVAVAAGDTVQWDNVGGLHNVESCDGAADPAQCSGQTAADGAFTSGPASTAAWTFSHTFVNAGSNPYFCVIHVGLDMVGDVTVTAPAPPEVPNGANGPPMLVAKTVPDGSTLNLDWDVTTCSGNADHHVVHGFGSDFPPAIGGTWSPSGGECLVGAPPFAWAGVPDPTVDPTSLLWFVVVADDGATTEGSWGEDSAGNERNGPGAGGSSGNCANVKDLTNVCP